MADVQGTEGFPKDFIVVHLPPQHHVCLDKLPNSISVVFVLFDGFQDPIIQKNMYF